MRAFSRRLMRAATTAMAVLGGAWAAAPSLADSGRDSTVPTGWSWYHTQPGAVLDNLVNNANQRPVALRRSPDDPSRYDFATVTNAGAYGQGFWYYYGINATQVGTFLNNNHARLISLDPYASGGNTLFNVVMVDNTGANAKGWWWYFASSPAQLAAFAGTNNARPVALQSYSSGGGTVYGCIMVARTGADNLGWGWHFGVSSATISSYLNNNSVRLIDLQQTGADTFNAVYEQSSGQRWYWYFGQSDAGMNDKAGNLGCRIFQCQSFGGSYSALLMQNGNDETERIGGLMRATGVQGNLGCYLKEVNGPVLVDLQSDRVFEPASGIKLPIHLHAMHEVFLGNIGLLSSGTVYSGYNGSCPQDTGPFSETLQTSLRLMMENSDNARTQSVRARFGDAAINATAHGVGASSTLLVPTRIGCGPCDPNGLMRFTLADAGRMYEAVANGFLGPDGPGTVKAKFYDLMYDTNSVGLWVFANVIDQEAAAAGMTNADKASFSNQIYFAAKGGDYTINCNPAYQPGGEFHSGTAWYRIPFKTSACTTVFKEYVSGGFVDHADATFGPGVRSIYEPELSRGPIRAAIATWVQYHHDNDTCGASQTLPGAGSYSFDTSGACSTGTDEPQCQFCCNDPGVNHDIWYKIVNPPACTAVIDTEGSTFDTKLAIYRNACPSGNGLAIACNDDASAIDRQSRVSFASTGAETYYIRVGGFGSAVGAGTLHVAFTHPNEACAAAAPIPGPGSYPFNTAGVSTNGPSEGNCSFCCNDLQVHQDLWYVLQNPPTEVVTIDTFGSAFDTKLAVYGGVCPTANDTAIACNDDFAGHGNASQVTFRTSGRLASYYIRVGGYLSSAGAGVLNVSVGPVCAADFNRDGALDPDDLSDFISCYFSVPACPGADWNADGNVDPDDLSDYISAYFGGC